MRRHAAPRCRVALQALQIRAQFGRRLAAQVAVLLERLRHDLFEPRRQRGMTRGERLGILVEDFLEDDRGRLSGERRTVRASRSSPRACSGDMYATVPSVVPGLVSTSARPSASAVSVIPTLADAAFARPKSRNFTRWRGCTKMFAGLISR